MTYSSASDAAQTGAASRLVVVSNRLPISLSRSKSGKLSAKFSSGGLVSALEPVLSERGGLWIGWSGLVSESNEAHEVPAEMIAERAEIDGYSIVPVALTRADIEGFYEGFSNQVIWPLFHDLFTNCNFQPEFWDAYCRVNQNFAAIVRQHLEPDDIVWVHDYHLMRLATELRADGLTNRIGFFNHIPFPVPDILRRLPWRSEILADLLAFDLLGFQTEADVEHFRESVLEPARGKRRKLAADTADGAAITGFGTPMPRMGSFPISIDYDHYATKAASDAVAEISRELELALGGRTVVLGVDRLDYSKGLPNKLAAFRYLLEKHPELEQRVSLIQYVIPSREKVPEYYSLRRRLERMVGEINGGISTAGWIPVHYHFGSLDKDTLCAYYRMADVALVTSLKDGMNLVAKEYCAAQVGEPGTLVLSEFTGAAVELAPHALLVNPYDVEDTGEAIYRACTMSASERSRRMRALRAHIRAHDVRRWVDDFVTALKQTVPVHDRPETAAGGAASS